MDNGVVILEHVDLINVLKLLHAELLDGWLELLVLFHGVVVDNFLGSSLGTYVKLKSAIEQPIRRRLKHIKGIANDPKSP